MANNIPSISEDNDITTLYQPTTGPAAPVGPLPPIGGDDWTPERVAEIKKELMDLLTGPDGKIRKNMSTFELFLAMYLMQKFGEAQTGVQATLQTRMNQYFDKLQGLWKYFQDSYSPDPNMNNGEIGADTYGRFLIELNALYDSVTKDDFFTKGEGKSIQKGLMSTLEDIMKQTNIAYWQRDRHYEGKNPLWAIWQEYDPSIGGATGQGNPALMENFSRTMSALNTQLTTSNNWVAAVTKTVTSTWQAEQQNMTNFLDQLVKQIKSMLSNIARG